RQMPQLIEKGYLYIAQPPLYKIKRGNTEIYLKDEAALNEYVVSSALEEAQLKLKGEVLSGEALAQAAERSFKWSAAMDSLARRMPIAVVEAAAVSDFFNTSEDAVPQAIKRFATRLNDMSRDGGGWSVAVNEAGVNISRTLRGVAETYLMDEKLFTG